MKITSPVFREGGIIPSRYTCEGVNVNPPLEFHNIPLKANSLVLIVEDPDVPSFVRPDRMWDHWLVFNIPPTYTSIEDNTTPKGLLGKTTFGNTSYGGPCPPDREHRYFFKLYALSILLPLSAGASKRDIEKAMEGHILATAELIGLYEKGKGY